VLSARREDLGSDLRLSCERSTAAPGWHSGIGVWEASSQTLGSCWPGILAKWQFLGSVKNPVLKKKKKKKSNRGNTACCLYVSSIPHYQFISLVSWIGWLVALNFIRICHISRAWWRTPLIPALGRQRQVDFWVRGQPGLQSEVQDSQGYTEKPCLEKQKTKNKQKKRICHIHFFSSWGFSFCFCQFLSTIVNISIFLLFL
jgi:hypothetical protein